MPEATTSVSTPPGTRKSLNPADTSIDQRDAPPDAAIENDAANTRDAVQDEASDVSWNDIQDATDETECPHSFFFVARGAREPASSCGGAICQGAAACIPACALRSPPNPDPFPCGESTCQANEICTTFGLGVDSSLPNPPHCLAAPAKVCAPGKDCCYDGCSVRPSISITIDLETRTMQCGAE